MKHFANRITALVLVLFMTASLFASCSADTKYEVLHEENNSAPFYEKYAGKKVDLSLGDKETVMDAAEIDGGIRLTVGTTNDEAEEVYGTGNGIPYKTEYRYYDMAFEEDITKRENTIPYHQIASVTDSSLELIFGGEPFESPEWGRGAQYHFYQNGKIQEGAIYPERDLFGADVNTVAAQYNAMAQIMLYEGAPYASMNYCSIGEGENGIYYYRTEKGDRLYINGSFVDTWSWTPGDPHYTFCGLTGINGVPYALLEIEGQGRLIPLTAETTELTFDGIDIGGKPTGGAFTDGRWGYFMSDSELWRTDGKETKCIADLIPYGINKTSVVRSVCSLSDGRILVVADGKLIELSDAESNNEQTKLYTIGVIDHYGSLDDLNLAVSKYNDSSEKVYFRVKEYDNLANLNLAILSGDIAMVVTSNRFALNQQVKQGALASLDEVAPRLFEKDVLIETVVDATRMDGVCYYLPEMFDVQGENLTDPSLISDGTLFDTRQEYYDFIIQNDPDYFKRRTPEDIFDTFANDLDQWINWEEYTSHFDDGTFEDMLVFCNQGVSEDEAEQYQSWLSSVFTGQFARDWTVGSFILKDSVESFRFTEVKKAQDYQKAIRESERNWVQLDFPMPSSVHDGYGIIAHNFFAVVENEKSRNTTGELLEWLILEHVTEEFPDEGISLWIRDGFSINRDETDRYLRRLLNAYVDPEENPKKKELAQLQNSMSGEEPYKTTWSYIHNADHFVYTENEIYEVMKKEAASYFAGDITAKQAAEYVQNRISIYLAEQS